MRTRSIVPVAVVLGLAGLAVGQTDPSRAYSAELLADANARINSAGEDAAMPKVGGALQFRYDVNVRDNVPGGNDTTNGFQTRLTKVWFTGTTQDKFTYRVQGDFDVESGDFVLRGCLLRPPDGRGLAHRRRAALLPGPLGRLHR